MSTEFISFLAQPGDTILNYDRKSPSSTQNRSIPHVFKEAMSVREEVFVKEQHVPLENEFDADDPRSFHWVVYASVDSSKSSSPPPNTSTSPTQQQHNSSGGRSRTFSGSKADETRRGSDPTATRVPVGTIRLVPPPHPPHPAPGSSHAIDNSEARASSSTHTTSPSARATTHDDGGGGPVEPYVKLTRLATLPAYRRLGLGRLLVNTALTWAASHAALVLPLPDPAQLEEQRRRDPRAAEAAERGWRGLVLVHAQAGAQPFWERFGFRRDEAMGVWEEEGIAHVGMWRRVEVVEGERRRRRSGGVGMGGRGIFVG